MADPEHLRLLLSGAVAWNCWRGENPHVRPDLSEASLRNANLCWYDLRRANLQAADLSGEGFLGQAVLRWALLDQADLRGANLRSADLTGATLPGANLVGASLRGATLSWSDLTEAALRDADLEEANLAWADFSRAEVHGIKLSNSLTHGTIGLEGVERLPSSAFPYYPRVSRYPFVPKSGEWKPSEPLTTEQQFKLLRDGVAGWNAWRAQNEAIWPNLRGIDLRGLHLEEANLRDADLSGVNLSGSCLRRADLSGAFLRLANLENADLSYVQAAQATFTAARLRGSDMTGAVITKAMLDLADFREVHADSIYGEESDFLNANLSGTHSSGAMLRGSKFHGANLSRCRLSPQANLMETDLSRTIAIDADLSGSNFERADLTGACLIRANLSEAYLFRAEMTAADLRSANLQGADLIRTDLIKADLRHADLSDARIYGVAAWDLQTDKETLQTNLIVTWPGDPVIRVDSIELAQFLYLLLNHEKLRATINSVAERGVLLLGRFGGGGLEVLRATAAELRKAKYLPMIFDFDRPRDRNYTETVKTLVGLSRFVIVDLSGPSVPQELYATIPHFKIPFIPIIEEGRPVYAMFADLLEYPWVLRPELRFANTDELLAMLPTRVIAPAEAMHEQRQRLLTELFGRAG